MNDTLTIQANGYATKTLDQLWANDYADSHREGLAEDTIRMGLTAFRHFAEFLGRPAMLADLTDDNLRRYMDYRLHERHRKATTVNGETRPIKALWNWLWKNRIVDHRPDVAPFQVRRRWEHVEPYHYEELQALIEECRLARGFIGRVKASLWWAAFFEMQFDIEERPAVLLALRWDGIDWDKHRILLPSGARGNHRRPRSIYLQVQTRQALRRIEQPERTLIFGDGINAIEFRVLFKQLIGAAGLEWERYDSSPKTMLREFSRFRQAAATVAGGEK